MKTDRQIADAATPGPWNVRNLSDVFTDLGAANRDGVECNDNDAWQISDTFNPTAWVGDDTQDMSVDECDSNAQFIAHFNPAKILSMLDELEAAKAALQVFKEKIAQYEYILRQDQEGTVEVDDRFGCRR
jgi:hypothetical protein